jgi:hypothetical protein
MSAWSSSPVKPPTSIRITPPLNLNREIASRLGGRAILQRSMIQWVVVAVSEFRQGLALLGQVFEGADPKQLSSLM